MSEDAKPPDGCVSTYKDIRISWCTTHGQSRASCEAGRQQATIDRQAAQIAVAVKALRWLRDYGLNGTAAEVVGEAIAAIEKEENAWTQCGT